LNRTPEHKNACRPTDKDSLQIKIIQKDGKTRSMGNSSSNHRVVKSVSKLSSLLLCALIFTSAGVCWGKTTSFQDIKNQSLHSDAGTLEFRVQLLKDISSDPHNHVLLLAVSSDSLQHIEIQIIQDKLIVQRRFGQCLLTAFSHPYSFRPGDWHSLKLTWNAASSKFYVDYQEIKKMGIFSGNDLFKWLPGIKLGLEDNFKIEQFQVVDHTDISVDPEDLEFVKKASCPNLAQLINENPQEKYRDIGLHHFPDQASRDKIKAYLALLPRDFAGTIKKVVFVEDARASKGGENGSADIQSGSIVLKGSVYDDPAVFFHEAAHLYDDKLKINFGVTDQQSEWAAISGASCYFKGVKMDEFYKDFKKTSIQNAILGVQGGQCASEDLAIWVGTVYDYYLNHKTFADRLDPKSPKYSPKNIKKLDFILKKGFISQEIYDQVTH
jgi:hypothetical protein